MSNEEANKRYERKVSFLRKNIPPDDIYEFAEQALTCAEFFLSKWNDWVDINEECEKHRPVEMWVKNLVGLRILEKQGYNQGISVKPLPEDLN